MFEILGLELTLICQIYCISSIFECDYPNYSNVALLILLFYYKQYLTLSKSQCVGCDVC